MDQKIVSISDIIPQFFNFGRSIIELLWERPFLREKMIYDGRFYWLYKKGEKKDGPFCPGCYEDYIKRIHLQPPSDGFYICNTNPKHKYKDPDYEPPEFDLLKEENKKYGKVKSDNILKALNEAIDALGDIIKNCTNQQKKAYELCVKTRDNLLKTPQEVVK